MMLFVLLRGEVRRGVQPKQDQDIHNRVGYIKQSTVDEETSNGRIQVLPSTSSKTHKKKKERR